VCLDKNYFFFFQSRRKSRMNLYFLDIISSSKVNIDPRRRKARYYLKVSDPRIRKGDLIRCKNRSKELIFDGKKIREINTNGFVLPVIPKVIRVSHKLLPEHWSRVFPDVFFFLEDGLQDKLKSSLRLISNNTLRGSVRIGKHKYKIEVSANFYTLSPRRFKCKDRERWLVIV
jgi:hypothetical protein